MRHTGIEYAILEMWLKENGNSICIDKAEKLSGEVFFFLIKGVFKNTQTGETWQVCQQKEEHLEGKKSKVVVRERMQLKT